MLLASNHHEARQLQHRAELLQQNGIRASYHNQAAAQELEPALTLPEAGGALLVESDSQLVSISRRPKLHQRHVCHLTAQDCHTVLAVHAAALCSGPVSCLALLARSLRHSTSAAQADFGKLSLGNCSLPCVCLSAHTGR